MPDDVAHLDSVARALITSHGPVNVRLQENGPPGVRTRGFYANITERNAKATPLLQLPGELRNIIWEYVLRHPKGFALEDRPGPQRKDHFPLLRVRRQIYAETSPIPFQINTFTTDDVWDAMPWPFRNDATPAQRAAITTVVVYTHWANDNTALYIEEMLDTFPGIKKETFSQMSGTMTTTRRTWLKPEPTSRALTLRCIGNAMTWLTEGQCNRCLWSINVRTCANSQPETWSFRKNLVAVFHRRLGH